jgi:ribosomal protein S14
MSPELDAYSRERALSYQGNQCVFCGLELQVNLNIPRKRVRELVKKGWVELDYRVRSLNVVIRTARMKRPSSVLYRDYKICKECSNMPKDQFEMRKRVFLAWIKENETKIKRLTAAQNAADSASHTRVPGAEQGSLLLSDRLKKRTTVDSRAT